MTPLPPEPSPPPRHIRRSTLFGGGRVSASGDITKLLHTPPGQAPSPGAASPGGYQRSVSNLPIGPGVGPASGRPVSDGGGVSAAAPPPEVDKDKALTEACELLLLQRWCRDLLLEEFVTTLHLVRLRARGCMHRYAVGLWVGCMARALLRAGSMRACTA